VLEGLPNPRPDGIEAIIFVPFETEHHGVAIHVSIDHVPVASNVRIHGYHGQPLPHVWFFVVAIAMYTVVALSHTTSTRPCARIRAHSGLVWFNPQRSELRHEALGALPFLLGALPFLLGALPFLVGALPFRFR